MIGTECSVENCSGIISAKGYCHKHYQRVRKTGSLERSTGIDRFYRGFKKGGRSECWSWLKGKDDEGYGCIYFDGKRTRSHRVSYRLYYGIIPDGLHVLHRCDNPSCVNPYHLFLGTNKDNMKDKVSKNRQNKGSYVHCSKLTKEEVLEVVYLVSQGWSERKVSYFYNINSSSVNKIMTGISWSWLTGITQEKGEVI